MNVRSVFSTSNFFFLTLALVYFLLVALEIKEFYLWSQVDELYANNYRLNIQFILGHAHGMRYLLVFPFYALAEFLNVEPNRVFSIGVVLMICCISVGLAQIINMMVQLKRSHILKIIFFIIISILSTGMNGRLMFGFLSYTMFILGFCYLSNFYDKRINIRPALFLITGSLFFGFVSSGVAISLFVISGSSIFFLIIASFIKKNRAFGTPIYAYFVLLYLAVTPLILTLVFKNYNYFVNELAITDDGDLTLNLANNFVSTVREHGVFGSSTSSGIIAIIFVGLLFLTILYGLLFRRCLFSNLNSLIVLYCSVSLLVLSLFGTSILMLGFIPAIIMTVLMLLRVKESPQVSSFF